HQWRPYAYIIKGSQAMQLSEKERSQMKRPLRVCVPVHGFPVTGGIRAVLASIAQIMDDDWQMEYLTQYVGLNAQTPAKAPFRQPPTPGLYMKDALVIHKFGAPWMAPWQFPMVWLYALAGWWKLSRLIREGEAGAMDGAPTGL